MGILHHNSLETVNKHYLLLIFFNVELNKKDKKLHTESKRLIANYYCLYGDSYWLPATSFNHQIIISYILSLIRFCPKRPLILKLNVFLLNDCDVYYWIYKPKSLCQKSLNVFKLHIKLMACKFSVSNVEMLNLYERVRTQNEREIKQAWAELCQAQVKLC